MYSIIQIQTKAETKVQFNLICIVLLAIDVGTMPGLGNPDVDLDP